MEQVKSSKELGQVEQLTRALKGKDLIGVAQTGYLDKLEHQLCFVPARRKDLLQLICSSLESVNSCLSDVGIRGLNIPSVDTVINYTVPPIAEDYTLRVERTGFSILLVNQYEIVPYMEIERQHIGKRLRSCYAHDEEAMS
ncbi:DEAD-box ATP-dependent RNA helicase 10-like protein, partial [Tanacetum coccineum]